MRRVLERLLNLLAFLLTADRPVTADEIRYTVAGYDSGSDEAFKRMFERDKEVLRRLGIPIRIVPTDRWEVEGGYRISPDDYRLPDPDLTDEERTALWLAAQVVRIGGRPAGPEAILKLGGARLTSGVEPFAADLGADPDLLAHLFTATVERRLVTFTYRGSRRTVAPHGLGHRRGHWYLVAVEGDDTRVFRIDRMEGVRMGHDADAFSRRPDVSVRSEIAAQPWEAGTDRPTMVRVRFDPDVAWWALRRMGGQAEVTEDLDGGVTAHMRVNHVDAFVGWVLSFGDQAEVLGPAEVRAAVIERVRAM